MNIPASTPLLNSPIVSPACWTGASLRAREDWIYTLSTLERDELQRALEAVASATVSGFDLGQFVLPKLSLRLKQMRHEVLHGTGLVLLRGLPVEDHDEASVAKMLWGLGLYLGVAQPQDAAGSLLHHVRDTGVSVAGRDDVRTYETKEAQPWHNDGGDIFMLLCREVAAAGGESFVASAYTVFNSVLERDPSLARTLQEAFHFDARGQQLAGLGRVQTVPIFTWHLNRLYTLHKRHYIEHAQRFDEVPPLTTLQRDALDAFDEVCDDPEIHLEFALQPGDIEIGHNFTVLHRRGAFDKSASKHSRRHMLRLWLGLPDGWPLPECYRETREFGPLFAVRDASSAAN
jgi:alpha-ketoglutarate-dependent taurine dioxygenase